MVINLNSVKVIYSLAAIIISISSAYGALLIQDIRDRIAGITADVERLEYQDIKDLTLQVHNIQLDLNRESFDKEKLLDDLEDLEEDIKNLERRVQ